MLLLCFSALGEVGKLFGGGGGGWKVVPQIISQTLFPQVLVTMMGPMSMMVEQSMQSRVVRMMKGRVMRVTMARVMGVTMARLMRVTMARRSLSLSQRGGGGCNDKARIWRKRLVGGWFLGGFLCFSIKSP